MVCDYDQGAFQQGVGEDRGTERRAWRLGEVVGVVIPRSKGRMTVRM